MPGFDAQSSIFITRFICRIVNKSKSNYKICAPQFVTKSISNLATLLWIFFPKPKNILYKIVNNII